MEPLRSDGWRQPAHQATAVSCSTTGLSDAVPVKFQMYWILP